ncbi:anti-sigma factor family protein [Mycolicibacterium sp. XJ879]
MTESGFPRSDDDRYLTWDAAYVLGSLSSEERREYEAHLQTCARCRTAVAELGGIPALLATIDVTDIDQCDPPALRPEVLDTLLDKVHARRRRTRWVTTAAVAMAAALLALGLVLVLRPGVLDTQPPAPQASGTELEMVKVSETPINATITVTGYGWGTRIDMACTYGDWGQRDAPPQNLGMVVIGRDGSREQVATWLGLSGATALPSANTPMQPNEIAAVQLVSADDDQVLLERRL